MLGIPEDLLLKRFGFPGFKIFFHCVASVLLNLHDLLPEVLPKQCQFLPQPLNGPFVN